jgi:regulator of protease activity HflC (stomatin/prohibitin superfamily)
MPTNKPTKTKPPKYTPDLALERLAKIKAAHKAELEAARKDLTESKRAELKAEKARLSALAEIERKAETHRKIIAGVVNLHRMAQDSAFKRSMQDYAKSCLSPDDLALFEAL